MPNAVTHPTPQELSAFSLGKLADAASAAVAGHLDKCSECRKALDSLPSDSFVGKVRAAKPDVSSLPARAGNAANAAAPFAPPKNLPPDLAHYAKYRFLRELGRGGMGVVYQAEQTIMGRTVAVKVINPRVLDHPDSLPRFQAEVRAAAKLDHPNIVRAHDAEQVGSMHLLVMEYIEGTSLAELVKKKGPLSIAYACHYIRQAALGLQHAFEQGMVHRDIKPQNLMVNPRGQVKVLDFGLARMRSERKQGCGLTQADTFMGTPEYVAPEQATDARSADTRADIYSLGCTLFFLLTGRPPFQEDTMVKLILAQIEKAPPVLHEVRADVPAELSAVVARMLAKDPARRFQTPIEVEQALTAFVKAGAKRPAAGVSPPTPGVASPATGTRIAANTSKIKAILGDVTRIAPARDAATGAFDGLEEAAVSSKRKAKPARKKAKPSSKQQWLVGGGIGVGVLLLALLGLWASGVFKVKTPDGILIVEVNEANPDVFVDGNKMTVSWDKGGKKAEIRVKPGTHRVEVKKDGFTVDGKELTFKDGDREIFTARLVPDRRVANADAAPPENVPPKAETPKPETPKPDRPKPETAKPITPAVPAPVTKEPQPRKVEKRDARKLFKARRSLKGKWIIVDDHLEQTSFDGNVCLYFGDPAWKDYDFAVEVMQGQGNDQVCQLFRRKEGRVAFFYGLGHARNSLFTIEKQRPGSYQGIGSRKGHLDQGKWYKMLVRVRGKHMQCFLNDAKIFDFESDEHPSGCVGLRTWGTQYRFRNIKVTAPDGTVLLEGLPDLNHELPDEKGVVPAATDNGFVPLFNGKDLRGWKVHPRQRGNWRIEKGVLVGSSNGVSHLYTNRGDYTDFHLRLEARINDRGNSGVYFRAPFGPNLPGNVRMPISLSNKPTWIAAYNAKLHAPRFGGLLIDPNPELHRTRELVLQPGEWLTYEVLVEGNHIVIKVNGQTTCDYTDEQRRYRKGHIVLQQHGAATVVEFRKIEITELPRTKP